MKTTKPFASLSLDLDNQWSYMKIHGDPGWESYPSYLEIVVPRVLAFLKKRELQITFFIVGQDAALEKNREALAAISAAGHEIGSHSFRHEPWLHLYSEQEIDAELARAEQAIEYVMGAKPVGFRGPGFSLSEATLNVLQKRGYLYDASTFPTFLGPLARAYYFMTARLDASQRKERKALFGTLGEGFRSLKPYRWRTATGDLIEIPVTTMPFFKLPFHASYLLYMSGYSWVIARAYFHTALAMCRLSRTAPSLLLHPLDFLGADDTQALSFFPGMRMPSAKKLELMGRVIDEFAAGFTIVNMRSHAHQAVEADDLPQVEPDFPPPPVRDSFPVRAA